MAIIEIDQYSGFCFGVTRAINMAEEQLADTGHLYCLGDIVHNSNEVERLKQEGLETITHEQLKELHDVNVLLRAHGEPPETYEIARRNNIKIIDATCPVVLKLQQRIKHTYNDEPNEPQIVIYGKRGHAEVNGLVGQTSGKALVIESVNEIDKIDFSRNVYLYSQTTKSVQELKKNQQTERRCAFFPLYLSYRKKQDQQPCYLGAEFYLFLRLKLLRSISCPSQVFPSCMYLQLGAGILLGLLSYL